MQRVERVVRVVHGSDGDHGNIRRGFQQNVQPISIASTKVGESEHRKWKIRKVRDPVPRLIHKKLAHTFHDLNHESNNQLAAPTETVEEHSQL